MMTAFKLGKIFNKSCFYSICFFLFTGCIKNPTNVEQGNMDNKSFAIKKYKKEYKRSFVDHIRWKHSESKECDAGNIPKIIRKKALLRINYFRSIAGLYPVSLKEEYNNLAQKAAFLMYINDRLSHYPSPSWKCYSKDAEKGARNSSLGSYYNFSLDPDINFISSTIRDSGPNNKSVGHRRSLLSSHAGKQGYGATYKTDALYNSSQPLTDSLISSLPSFIAYPVEGYNEIDLVFKRWSFGIPDHYDANLNRAEVKVKNENGTRLPLKVISSNNAYSDPTIVWEIDPILIKKKYLNKVLTVHINNVEIDDNMKDFLYKVKFFDQEGPKESNFKIRPKYWYYEIMGT